MSVSAERLASILNDAFNPPLTRQQRAVSDLASLLQDTRLSPAEITYAWQLLQKQLPDAEPELRVLYQPLVKAMAANTATPADVLTGVVHYAPRTLCTNPALPDLISAHPEWVRSLWKERSYEENETLMRLMRCGNAPRLLVERITSGWIFKNDARESENKRVMQEAQWHIAVTGEAEGDSWKAEVTEYWREYTGRISGDEKEMYQEFAIAGLLPDWAYGEAERDQEALRAAQERFQRATNPEITAEECAELARRDPSFAVRLAAVLNPVTPEASRMGEARYYLSEFGLILLPALRRRGSRPKTLEEIREASAQVMRLTMRSKYDHFIQKRLDLEAFLSVWDFPELVTDPRYSQAKGRPWYVLLGWVLGIMPDEAGTWSQAQRTGLLALTEDGNRWVHAAARARLHDPGVTFRWTDG